MRHPLSIAGLPRALYELLFQSSNMLHESLQVKANERERERWENERKRKGGEEEEHRENKKLSLSLNIHHNVN